MKPLHVPTLLVLLATSAWSQEPVNSTAATLPAPGVWIVVERVQAIGYGDDPTMLQRDVLDLASVTTVNVGLVRDVGLSLAVPLLHRDQRPGGDRLGFDDGLLTLKWRIWQHDFGTIDTSRVALILGTSLPWGADAFSSDSFDPVVGAVWTLIVGRHGANASLRYRFNSGPRDEPFVTPGTGGEDALYLDAAYLYRLSPAEFTADTSGGAWYLIAELNGVVEMNGDTTWLIAPGLMYEASRMALELSVQCPVYQDVTLRPEIDFTVTVGFRWLF